MKFRENITQSLGSCSSASSLSELTKRVKGLERPDHLSNSTQRRMSPGWLELGGDEAKEARIKRSFWWPPSAMSGVITSMAETMNARVLLGSWSLGFGTSEGLGVRESSQYS